MNTPYRSFSVGQSVQPLGNLRSRINGYYPTSFGALIVEEVDGTSYRVRPVGHRDVMEAEHFDLIPMNVTPTRLFVPAHMIKPGVTIRSVVENKTRLVTESIGGKVYFMDGGSMKDEPVEIYKMIGDPDDLFFFLREDYEDNH